MRATQVPALLASKLRCSVCGANLAYVSSKKAYRCGGYNTGWADCAGAYITEERISEFILNDIRRYAVLSLDECEKMTDLLMSAADVSRERGVGIIRGKIEKAEHRLGVIADAMKMLYEDKVSGALSVDRLAVLICGYETEESEIKETLPRLWRELELAKEAAGDINS